MKNLNTESVNDIWLLTTKQMLDIDFGELDNFFKKNKTSIRKLSEEEIFSEFSKELLESLKNESVPIKRRKLKEIEFIPSANYPHELSSCETNTCKKANNSNSLNNLKQDQENRSESKQKLQIVDKNSETIRIVHPGSLRN